MKHIIETVLICAVCGLAAQAFATIINVTAVRKDANGVTLQMNPGVLRLEVFSPRIIRVTYTPQAAVPDSTSLAVIAKPQRTKWDWREKKDEIILRTDEIQARVNRATGAVSFFDKNGAPMLAENPDGGKSLTPNRINGIDTLRSRQEFVLAPQEAVYGLGQHANGLMNYCGATVHLQQQNQQGRAKNEANSHTGYQYKSLPSLASGPCCPRDRTLHRN